MIRSFLDKVTNGMSFILAGIAAVFGILAMAFFRAWSNKKEELKEVKAEYEFEKKEGELNGVAQENIIKAEEELKEKKDEFKEIINNEPSIGNVIRVHNNQIQKSRD